MENRDGISLPLRMFDAAMAGNYTKEERLEMLEEQGMDINELLEKDIDSLSKRELEMVEAVLDAKAEEREKYIEHTASMVMAEMECWDVSAEKAADNLRIDPEIRGKVLDVVRSRKER